MSNVLYHPEIFQDTLKLRTRYRRAVLITLTLAGCNLIIIALIVLQLLNSTTSETFATTEDGRVIKINAID